ncbi:hypothetical protein DACRYDRAFT_111977 [Dacryopinax primogenitus]|uniref:Uncharacterized protein n=1 Tax=Dacryopinax primogenitus (strain DJM 731) TaxID=1858805 RepID=M5FVQ4_DACPD|nr:uncharacterized protein DACRYDRAFT_111977 [Dacryopinax primogenitus]EJT97441.1 hypothetical protein DACRYDRAFT_111977 [Dacryopinax primogenitus]
MSNQSNTNTSPPVNNKRRHEPLDDSDLSAKRSRTLSSEQAKALEQIATDMLLSTDTKEHCWSNIETANEGAQNMAVMHMAHALPIMPTYHPGDVHQPHTVVILTAPNNLPPTILQQLVPHQQQSKDPQPENDTNAQYPVDSSSEYPSTKEEYHGDEEEGFADDDDDASQSHGDLYAGLKVGVWTCSICEHFGFFKHV